MTKNFDSKDVLDVFNQCAPHWDQKRNYIHIKNGESRRLFHLLDTLVVSGHLLLDLGCGTGKVTGYVMEHFDQVRSVAIDISIKMLKHVRQRVKESFCLLSDVNRIGLADNLFNIVVCQQLLHHLPHPTVALKEIFRVMKSNSHLLVLTVGQQYQQAIFPYKQGDNMQTDLLGRTSQNEISYLLTCAGFNVNQIIEDHFTFLFNSFDNYFNFLLSIGTVHKIHQYHPPPKEYKNGLRKKLFPSIKNTNIPISIEGHYITALAYKT